MNNPTLLNLAQHYRGIIEDVNTADLPQTPGYEVFSKDAWSSLSKSTPLPLTDADVLRLRGLGDPIDLDEVDLIYRPLSRLLNLHIEATAQLHQARSTFLLEKPPRTPYVIGVAGSVAVGKSTTSRILQEMLARWPGTPKVALITTDGFLLPNAELENRGLMNRKGFPESYDRRSLLDFLTEVKSGAAEVAVPVYSHQSYDIIPGEFIKVSRPDVLIVEGLNVLQPAVAGPNESALAVSDFFDFSIFVDADEADIRKWYLSRFLTLRETAFARPDSFFHQYAQMSDDAAISFALEVWDTINGVNLRENILPTKSRATLVLRKGGDHHVHSVALRNI